jgi:hypothetical protein
MEALRTSRRSIHLHLPLNVRSGFGRGRVDEGETARERPCVQVHHLRDALGDPIRRARNHEGRVAVAEEEDVVEVLKLDEVDYVGYVGFEVDFRTREVHPFAQAGEGYRIAVVPLLSESAGYGQDQPPSQAPPTKTYVAIRRTSFLASYPALAIVR